MLPMSCAAKILTAANPRDLHRVCPQGESGQALCSQLAGIAFLPATLGLPGSADALRVLVSCNGAARQEAWPLVWSQVRGIGSVRLRTYMQVGGRGAR